MELDERRARIAVALEILDEVVLEGVRAAQFLYPAGATEEMVTRTCGFTRQGWEIHVVRHILGRLEAAKRVQNESTDRVSVGQWRLVE